MSKEKLVPKLRFEDFKNNQNWKTESLSENVQLKQGVQVNLEEQKFEPSEDNIRFIRIIDYTQNTNDLRYIDNNPKLNVVSKEDIVMVRYGAVGFVGRGISGAIANNMFTITPNENINKSFLYTYLKTDKIYNYLLDNSGSSAMPAINFETVNNLNLSYPIIKEQQKIGSFFKKIDKMIQLQQSKVNKVKDIKSAYLSEMFPKEGEKYPKKRFEGFTEPWEQVQVQDLFRITRGHVLSATKVTEYPTKKMKYPVYSSQTKNNGLMGYYHKYLYQNVITWTTDGANAGTVSYRPSKFYCTNVSGVLISNEGYANRMIAEALNQIAWKHVSKVGNPKLMNNIMAEITVTIPQSIKEQHKIAEFIRNLDNQISIEEEKLTKLEKLKQAYLNDMFV